MSKTEMTLAEIRETELGILKHFKAFCEKENIRYFLSNGTLLGAVKYGGFIPWDDDIDVFVPRADYDRLICSFADDERYRLFSAEREKRYRFPFAKLCDMTTEKIEDNIDNGVELGLDIDIFPLDAWADDHTEACGQVSMLQKRISWLALLKCRKAKSVNPVKRFAKSIFLVLMRFACGPLVRSMDRIATKYANNQNPKWLGCVAWCIYGKKEIIPAEVFEQTVPISFEGEVYPAPVGYDAYLRSLYGDYPQDPPADARKTHHLFTAYLRQERGGEMR